MFVGCIGCIGDLSPSTVPNRLYFLVIVADGGIPPFAVQ